MARYGEDSKLKEDDEDQIPPSTQIFWSMEVEPNKEVSMEEPAIDSFIVHITGVSFGAKVKTGSRTVIMCDAGDSEEGVPIAILREGSHESQSVDLMFSEGAIFSLKGNKVSKVTLTGFLQPPPHEDLGMDDVFDEENMQDAEVMKELLRRKMIEANNINQDEDSSDEAQQVQKRKRSEIEKDGDDDEDDEEDDSSSTPPAKKKRKLNNTPKQTKSQEPKQQKSTENESTKQATEQAQTKNEKKKSKKFRFIKGGVQIKDMSLGSGKAVKHGDLIKVKYVGQLENKKIFDRCIGKDGFDFKIGSNDVIRGWNFAMKGMKVGGKRRCIIPPKHAYGTEGKGDIPANAALTFTIEVVKIINS